jgi:hypothetical protein
MLGHLMEWFYSGLAGIKQAEHSVAFKNIEIKPEPVGDVTAARASYHCVYGTIVSEWKKHTDEFELSVEIPVNTTATIFIPAGYTQSITMNGTIVKAKHVDGKTVITVGSGKYIFKTK